MLHYLNHLKMNANKNEEGFTLIELLVVIVIIGILAAIALPIFLNQQKAAIEAGVKSDVRNTVSNVNTFLTSNPMASNLSASTPVKTDDKTSVTITGGWDNYSVKGTNTDVPDFSWCFTSTTGKYDNCVGGTAPGEEETDNCQFAGGEPACAADAELKRVTALAIEWYKSAPAYTSIEESGITIGNRFTGNISGVSAADFQISITYVDGASLTGALGYMKNDTASNMPNASPLDEIGGAFWHTGPDFEPAT